MADNEKTVAQGFADPDSVAVATSRDTVKGWNDRRKSNNQIISSMVPFVQLIGLFDEKEYEKMFNLASTRTPLHWDNGDPVSYNEKYETNVRDIMSNMRQQLSGRLINLYLISSTDHGVNTDPIEGIIMAEKVSQVKEPGEGGDASGGIGITDLQVDYGRSNILGSRKYNLRMTINNPAILDERIEYSKLATFGSQLVIIYGWSNPQTVPGYDAAFSPPTLELDPYASGAEPRNRLIVPLRNLGNGGYWSAARVSLNNYDFSFNEMGKMEINITLRDDATNGMASTVISSVAKKFKAFLQGDLFGRAVIDNEGNEFTLRDALHHRQLQLNKEFHASKGTDNEMSESVYTERYEYLINEFSDMVEIVGTESVPPESQAWNSDTYTNEEVQASHREATESQKGYPHQNALFSYKQVFRTVLDEIPYHTEEHSDAAEVEADDNQRPTSSVPTKQVIGYEKQPVYYFLGAIMDSLSMTVADVKIGISDSKVPAFYYNPISEDSKLSTAFESNLQSVSRKSNYEERIQEAVIRLKERFLPPSPVTHDAPSDDEGYIPSSTEGLSEEERRIGKGDDVDEYRRTWKEHEFNGMGNAFTVKKAREAAAKNSRVSGTSVIYQGRQTKERTDFIEQLYPTPARYRDLVYAPMRGHFVRLEKDELEQWAQTAWPFKPHTFWRIFIPDWKKDENDPENALGSPHGFDPLNPSEYRAALPFPQVISNPRSGLSPSSPGFEERSTLEIQGEREFGRGGRFFMVVSMKASDDDWLNAMPYDVWRYGNKDLWNLLQKKWHNLYIEYLGDYFEHIIRERVGECEQLGIPIEGIFNEALDLDWLTSRIFKNSHFAYAASKESVVEDFRGDDGSLKSYADVAKYFDPGDLNIESVEAKAAVDRSTYNTTIEESKLILNGDPAAATASQDRAGRWFSADGQYLGETAPNRGIAEYIKSTVEQINMHKEEVEQITGGRYERGATDRMGNSILVRFKNFMRLDASQTQTVENSTNPLIWQNPDADATADNQIAFEYAPVVMYDLREATPQIKEEWLLWNKHGIPTDNFQNIWRIENGGFIDEPNKAARWKEDNPDMYKVMVTYQIPQSKRLLDAELREIDRLQRTLKDKYESYVELTGAIEVAQRKLVQINTKLMQTKQYFNEATGGMELSIYDDTSDFDTPLGVDMGRDKDMILTTKVAQQWYLRMSEMFMWGATDVRNYGPPRGGQKYHLPSNNYQFRFDPRRRGWKTVGIPRRVIDPGAIPDDVISFGEQGQYVYFANMFSDLSMGVEVGVDRVDILSINQELKQIHPEGFRTSVNVYGNWTPFGVPGIPGEEGNNEWGFKTGPPVELEGGFMAGGNYVRTYKDFLNIMGLAYNPEWALQLKVMASWPMVKGQSSISKTSVVGGGTSVLEDFFKFADTLDLSTAPVIGTPEPFGSEDTEMLRTYGARGMTLYTMMDEIGNVIVEDHGGGYKPTGWYLDFGGDPVFLYPSLQTATKINVTGDWKDGVPPGHVLQTGIPDQVEYIRDSSGGFGKKSAGERRIGSSLYEQRANRQATHTDDPDDEIAGNYNMRRPAFSKTSGKALGRNPKDGQAVWDYAVNLGKAAWEFAGRLIEGDAEAWMTYSRLMLPGGLSQTGFETLIVKRNNAIKKMNDGEPMDYQGVKGYDAYGGRIDRDAHIKSLTLDMKRSMVCERYSTEDPTRYLPNQPGYFPGGPPNEATDWDKTGKIEGEYFRRFKLSNGELGEPCEYSGGLVQDFDLKDLEGNLGALKGVGKIIDPVWNNDKNLSNPDYPYGLGWYGSARDWDNNNGGMREGNGPWQFPTKKKNWVDWADFLYALGPDNGFGYFTQVDNSNYTSCMVQPGGAISDGLEINDGFVKFIIENVFAPLPQNRRCGARGDHKSIKIKGSDETDEVLSYNSEFRINDVTYGDLFGPLQDGSEDDNTAESLLDPASFGNIDNFRINNVANIPIRAQVVHNLLNKNNTNMSITQFIGEILRPGALGVNNIPNPQVAIRQSGDGTFEMISLSQINWDRLANNYKHLFTSNLGADETLSRFPEDAIVLDFKAKDSLIENIDMNSKFDPLVARAFRDAAVEFTGNTDALINFLSYKDVAKDLKTYLDQNTQEFKGDNNPIKIDPDNGRVTINKKMFFPEDQKPNPEIITPLTSFLQLSPSRLNNMRALMNAADSTIEGGVASSNYATSLMSNYMRKTTITIHGTTNISPFQYVIVKGIMPNLEGMYIVTNTRESITPQGFQTILEATLLYPPSGDARNGRGLTPEAEQDDALQIEFSDETDVEGAST